jgi:outer membrane lipase/esterase
MVCNWMRRALLALASVSLLSLAACGSGTIESQFRPARIISFGDALSDIGQGGTSYTVNDGGTSNWTKIVAAGYLVDLKSQVTGGTSYAIGNARVAVTPDAAGGSRPSIKQQIDAYLASNTLGETDLVLIEGGISDIIAEAAQLKAGTQSADQMVLDVQQAGRDLAAQVRRLVQAGANHVVVVGTYDLGRSPWATSTTQTSLLSNASSKFNEALLVSIVDLGNSVLYVDSAFFFNLVTAAPGNYGMLNAIEPVCTSVDAGPGIGIGAGEVNSALCTTATILPGAVYASYVFADKVYFAPSAQIRFGEYAASRVTSRW